MGRVFFVKVKAPQNWNEIVTHVDALANRICGEAIEHQPKATSNRHIRPEYCFQIILGLIFPQGGKVRAKALFDFMKGD